MSISLDLLAALFLPLFPLSMVFTRVFDRLRHPLARAALLLAWPQLGVLLIAQTALPPPDAFIVWALATAAFYAYRAIALRDVGLWIAFIAVSAWSLLWLGAGDVLTMHVQALAFSVPLLLLNLLSGDLERRFGAAHTRLKLGLAAVAPRYAAVFVVAMLAAVASPVFPNFFSLLATITHRVAEHGAGLSVFMVALVWVLWTWSGARLIQGIVVGEGDARNVADLSTPMVWAYAGGFLFLAAAGLALAGVLL
ncbi:MAG: hypothetical protein H6926_03705 [Chromatiales bacterium]|nr:hypothetical protein [Gammaproteobacteria bacterium]MCP5352281.1 hypothetical protein [Chromatiales bacterium]